MSEKKVLFVFIEGIHGLPNSTDKYSIFVKLHPKGEKSQGKIIISENNILKCQTTWSLIYHSEVEDFVYITINLKNTEFAKLLLPIKWFEPNKIVKETFPMRLTDPKLINEDTNVMLTVLIHRSENGDCAFNAPEGHLLVQPRWKQINILSQANSVTSSNDNKEKEINQPHQPFIQIPPMQPNSSIQSVIQPIQKEQSKSGNLANANMIDKSSVTNRQASINPNANQQNTTNQSSQNPQSTNNQPSQNPQNTNNQSSQNPQNTNNQPSQNPQNPNNQFSQNPQNTNNQSSQNPQNAINGNNQNTNNQTNLNQKAVSAQAPPPTVIYPVLQPQMVFVPTQDGKMISMMLIPSTRETPAYLMPVYQPPQ